MTGHRGFLGSKLGSHTFVFFLAVSALSLTGCHQTASPPSEQALTSAVAVTVNPGGPVVLKTSTAEFEVLPSGYVQAWLMKDGKRLTLDEPETGRAASGGYLVSGGKEIRGFALDFDHVKLSDAQGKLGPRGHVQVHILAEDLFGTLGVAYFQDLAGIGKVHAFLFKRLLQIVDVQDPELMSLNSSLQIRDSLFHRLRCFHDIFHGSSCSYAEA